MPENQNTYLNEQLPLYHATGSFDKLKKILREGFKPSYCEESISTDWSDEESKKEAETFHEAYRYRESFPEMYPTRELQDSNRISAYFPTISFCSVHLDHACQRMKSYGNYGVAMARNWGRDNGLNPVLYYEKSANVCKSFVRSFFWLRYNTRDIEHAIQSDDWISGKAIAIRSLVQTFAYAKNFYAPLLRGGDLAEENYPFGYEREWRIWFDLENKPKFVPASDFDGDVKNELNSDIKERLTFQMNDIEAVFVRNDGEKEELEKSFADLIGKVRINHAK